MPFTFYIKENDTLQILENTTEFKDRENLIWCDLFNPSKEDDAYIETLLGIEIPTREEMLEIELSNQLYVENGAIYCTGGFITKTDTAEPEIHAITFILTAHNLVTIRYTTPSAFQSFSKKIACADHPHKNHFSIATGLLEASVNRLADVIQFSGHELDRINSSLFRPAVIDKVSRQKSTPDFEDILRQIGIQADLNSKSRESLSGIGRMLGFLKSTSNALSVENEKVIDVILSDISGLTAQADSQSNKSSFLLDAALGLVGLQQTSIIKIFSVASVIFLPPTLVASIYGMNFKFMPELNWALGYPMALILMVLSAWLPYRFFKKQKWL